MKIHRVLAPSASLLLLPAVLALPAVLGPKPQGDPVAFEPDGGTRLSKELGIELSFHLEDMTLSVNGQEMPAEAMGGDMDEALLLDVLVRVTDEYVSSARGKHLELLRTYDDLRVEGGPEGDTEEMEGLEDLEGTTLRFKWDEDQDDYVKSFAEGSGDEDGLSDLSPDMDFLALLPEDEVEPGDRWSVRGEKLAAVFLPGGMFPLPDDGEDAEMKQVVADELETQLEEAFADFELLCTYDGSHEEEGRRIGEIAFKFDGKVSLDLSDLFSTLIELQSGGQEIDVDFDILATIDLEFEGEGTLLWDLAARHVRSFAMSWETTILADVEADMEMMGESQQMALSAEVSGEGKWKLTTSRDE